MEGLAVEPSKGTHDTQAADVNMPPLVYAAENNHTRHAIGSPEWCDEAERAEWAFMAQMIGEAEQHMPHKLSGLHVARQIALERADKGWRSVVPTPQPDTPASTTVRAPVGAEYVMTEHGWQPRMPGASVTMRPLPDDLFTHRSAWRDALENCIMSCTEIGGDASYWKHELRVFDRTWANLFPSAGPGELRVVVAKLSGGVGDPAAQALVVRLRDTLKALLAVVKAEPSLQGREHIDLGIQVYDAIDRAEEYLLATPPTEPAVVPASGIELAARFVEKRRDDYVNEHGSYDGSTGVTEFPGNGDEYVGELEEIIEGIRALVPKVPSQFLATEDGEFNGNVEPAVVPVLDAAVSEFIAKQEPLGAEFEAAWDANRFRLFEDDTPKPAPVADDLVERGAGWIADHERLDGLDLPYGISGSAEPMLERAHHIIEALTARITADAAVIAGKDAEIERLCAEIIAKADLIERKSIRAGKAEERAEAAEARITDLQAEVDALTFEKRGADQVMTALEALVPDWRSYRDIVDAITCKLARGVSAPAVVAKHAATINELVAMPRDLFDVLCYNEPAVMAKLKELITSPRGRPHQPAPAVFAPVPDNQTPLDSNGSHRYLHVFKQGLEARDTGTHSPYHGASLEHCLHASGWVQRDLRLALDKAQAKIKRLEGDPDALNLAPDHVKYKAPEEGSLLKKLDDFALNGRLCGSELPVFDEAAKHIRKLEAAIKSYEKTMVAIGEADASDQKKISELRETLILFRAFVQNNTAAWFLGSNHHHPMWSRVAEAIGGPYEEPSSGERWQWVMPAHLHTAVSIAMLNAGRPPVALDKGDPDGQ